MTIRLCLLSTVGLLLSLPTTATPSFAKDLFVGAASADITPTGPAAICGMSELRVMQTIETPLMANIVVLESRDGDQAIDTAVMVACDLTFIGPDILSMVRDEVHNRLPDLDTKKIFLSATHTHNAPVTTRDVYRVPKNGVVQVEEYQTMITRRIADAIVQAWNGRTRGSVTWGLGHAVVARNRRTVYADGHAEMLGKTDRPDFRGIEGYEDHGVDVLFFWNTDGKPVSIVVGVSCPAQMAIVDGAGVNADFWHPVRELLRQRYGDDVTVLGLIGAAGDQCPAQSFFAMYGKNAEERMRALRNMSHLEELARRIVGAVNDVYETIKDDRHFDVPVIHTVQTICLPMRLVTNVEYSNAKARYEAFADEIAKNPGAADRSHARMRLLEATVQRFELQKTNPQPACEMELHAIRVGDVAVCTNSFELFTDYGIQIKGRSPAIQTLVVQLAGSVNLPPSIYNSGWGYLPTERAVRGGSYSTDVEDNPVGPEGGQVLVNQTVELINSMWTK